MIQTLLGEMDERLLKRTTGVVDDEREHTEWVEYCLPDCVGRAHVTGKPDGEGLLCSRHIHRSAHVRLKKMSVILGEAGDLNSPGFKPTFYFGNGR